MGQKNPKGSVSIENAAGRLRLRWRYQSKRYSLNLFSHSKANLLQAKKIACTIENDMVNDSFDCSLIKYGKNETGVQNEKKSIVEHYEYWVSAYRNMDCDRHVHYHAKRNMMQRWGTLLKKFFGWLLKQKVIQINPLEDVQPKKVKKGAKRSRKPFTEEEITKILHAFKNNTCCPTSSRYKHSHYYPVVYFIFSTYI
jgi:integrase